ncbi:hypothetical protein [Ferrovum myxofaciens]|uniref:Uncharacterized protein n=1 Tax=Ferrovum myxofaciens TaxID=416213 RepID=A0A9E6MZB9_9PROT|nr:hypothetical protein [Ferrovum myxofaciens]QKE37451.1 MAG: hypothetical protein HO273_00805 [Ferrovum myxofaciens]QWY75099.1 MAG: hypothetical protein JVY19_01225 [Ferrovum myxofaciens]QWY77835.1 MAG: hypothetical protein JZL65_01735 [Ferrovum myxofaciens]
MPNGNNLILTIVFLFGLKLFNGRFAVSAVMLPGTIAHECAHYFVGLLLNARPTKLVLWPIRSGNSLVLGEVVFSHLTWYNAALTGMAPLLLIPVVWRMSLSAGTGLQGVGMAWLEAVLLSSSIPSGTDFRVAFRFTLAPVVLAAGTIALLAHH